MEYKYDLAISLLDEDAQLAWEIVKSLGNEEKVFFYKKDVDELVFKDGANVFGDVFSEQSRFVLVLFRENYGKSDWTGLEYSIIRDRYKRTIKDDNCPILFCKLDDSKTPNWLSDTYIYHKLDGLDDLVALLRKKITDHGGIMYPRTSEERLQLKIKERDYEKSFEYKSYSSLELAEEARANAADLRDKLFQKLKSNASENNLFFKDNTEIISANIPIATMNVVFDGVVIRLRDHQEAINSIYEAYIEINIRKDDKNIKQYRRKFYKTIEGETGWRGMDKKGFISSVEFVEIIFKDLVNII